MSTKLMEEENTVYEIDEECMQQKEQKRKEQRKEGTEEEIYQGLRWEGTRKRNAGVWILILYLLVCRS
jgi:hypothetical protein